MAAPPAPRAASPAVWAAAVALALAAGLASCTSGRSSVAGRPHRSAAAGDVVVTEHACAPGWVAPATGRHTFAVSNRSEEPAEVELAVADRLPERVFGAIEVLAPGTTRPLTVELARGTYAWRCVRTTGDVLVSAPRRVTGPPVAGRSFVPVTSTEVLGAIVAFQATTADGLATLATDTAALRSLADATPLDLAATRRAWLVAHLDYARLGAAYGAFGASDAEIDGRPDGLPGGVGDPSWTGFLALEHALWHGGAARRVPALADRLDRDVRSLRAAFPAATPGANDLTIRAHEILEDALQFDLTGHTDQGSHTGLATVRADVDGTRADLDALAPLFTTRDPGLLRLARRDLDRLAALLDGFRRADGTWAPVDQLTRSRRQLLDGTVGQAVEDLATIPDVLELPKHGGD